MSESRIAASPRKTPSGDDRATPSGRERRKHTHLRELIDEMMASLRAAANRDIISAEERADADAQLAAIMARVHAEAVSVAKPVD